MEKDLEQLGLDGEDLLLSPGLAWLTRPLTGGFNGGVGHHPQGWMGHHPTDQEDRGQHYTVAGGRGHWLDTLYLTANVHCVCLRGQLFLVLS